MPKITYTLEAEQDSWYEIEGSFASGDDEQDRKDVSRIQRQLRNGNVWAWCQVCVTAEYGRFEGDAYLGCCSYKSREDFMKSDYYKSLQHEARQDMLDTMKKYVDAYPILLAQEEEQA